MSFPAALVHHKNHDRGVHVFFLVAHIELNATWKGNNGEC